MRLDEIIYRIKIEIRIIIIIVESWKYNKFSIRGDLLFWRFKFDQDANSKKRWFFIDEA